MDAYLEIGYHMGADAQTLAGTLLNDYGTIASMETLGEVKLGGLTAYGAKGVTVQRELEAYLIPTANGCISVVLFGHTHRALSETMQGLYVVNPGTAGVGAMCTYACIETRDGAIRSAGIHAIPEA